MVTIVDYGMGNLRSVEKGIEKVGGHATVTGDADAIAKAERLILPGVGAFRDAMHHLRECRLIEPIRDYLKRGRPFLGICLGLQMLFDKSYEDGEYEGLSVFPGEVIKFDFEGVDIANAVQSNGHPLKVPHMGWNRLNVAGPNRLLAGLPDNPSVYFVHSYHVVPKDRSIIAAEADYGIPFTAMVAEGPVFATQFHPEKSQDVGLAMLKNFIELN